MSKELFHNIEGMVAATKYADLKTFPLGEYKGKALQTKYQYKSNSFVFVEDNYDYIVSLILQSINRQESILFIDYGEDLYNGTYNFFKQRSYNIAHFTSTDSEKSSDTLSLWESAYDIDGLVDMAEYILEPIWRHIMAEDLYESIHDELVAGLAAFLSYAISDARLKNNKFQFLLNIVSECDIGEITEMMESSNDTSQIIWSTFMEETTNIDLVLDTIEDILAILSKKENNSRLSFDSYGVCTLSETSSVTYIDALSEYSEATNIILYSILKNNILYHEKTKGRGNGINIIINHIERLNDIEYLLELFEYTRKYKMNVFITCGSIETLESKFDLRTIEKLLKLPQYILIRIPMYANPLRDFINVDIDCREIAGEEDKEILITDNQAFICNKYNTPKHRLYKVFYD